MKTPPMIVPQTYPLTVMPQAREEKHARKNRMWQFFDGKKIQARRKRNPPTPTPLLVLRYDTEAWARYQTRQEP